MALTVRTDPEMEEALDALTQVAGQSRQDVIRRAVLELHERNAHQSRFGEATSEMLSRWSDVLTRLGSE